MENFSTRTHPSLLYFPTFLWSVQVPLLSEVPKYVLQLIKMVNVYFFFFSKFKHLFFLFKLIKLNTVKYLTMNPISLAFMLLQYTQFFLHIFKVTTMCGNYFILYVMYILLVCSFLMNSNKWIHEHTKEIIMVLKVSS